MNDIKPCVCGSGQPWLACCGRYISLGAYPTSVEGLMRSRYSAYCLRDVNYLTKTWHPSTCPDLSLTELQSTTWLRLEVVHAQQGLKSGVVEFNAYFQGEHGEQCLHEISRFKKHKSRWVYLDGTH